jgi:hypothetical protein
MMSHNFIDLINSKDGTFPAWAWPGGYPLFYLMCDGEALCPCCVNKEIWQVLEATFSDARYGWTLVGVAVNWEDVSLYCSQCGSRITSAYGELD